MSLDKFLTEDEINQAIQLYQISPVGTFAKKCRELIIQPNIDRINAAIGQENDPLYLAYAVEYVMMVASNGNTKRDDDPRFRYLHKTMGTKK
jgi:hypothetical protein